MKKPLLDKDFLKELDSQNEREIFTKIISMDFDENPIEEISGRVTQGSINIDGTSAVRRSCSITLVAQELNIHDYYWGLNTKFKFYIGMKNKINSEYPEIIWIPFGIYIISSFNTSQSTNSYTVSIQGKDKMCLLNGDVGGVITALTVDFGHLIEIASDGTQTTSDLLLKEIIKEAVHEYAKEPFHNIIVNDLDDVGLELLEYRGTSPMYLIIDNNADLVTNMRFGGTMTTKDGQEIDITDSDKMEYDQRIDLDYGEVYAAPTIFVDDSGNEYTVCKVMAGDVVGYRITDLVYAGDLISNVGESVTAMLDKIVSMLGEYEYFYNTDGQFVFQRKKTYVSSVWTNLTTDGEYEIYPENAAYTSSCAYSFEDGNLITSFQNNPNLLGLRNDFSIWGTRTSTTGAELPVHLRYAIDKKPSYYRAYDGKIYVTKEFEETNGTDIVTRDSFRTAVLPEGLDDNWWEVEDWANYYEYLTGNVPLGYLYTYWTGYTYLDLAKLFDGASTWKAERPLFLFTVKPDGTMYFLGHNPQVGFDSTKEPTVCGHTYAQMMAWKRDYGYITYFYNPEIPDSDITDEVKEKMDASKMIVCDWREIIYQMSLDYNKHMHDDDFCATIAANNIDFYPTGYTGYEQYYTDLNGFWRQLYDIYDTYSYDVAYVTRSKYNANPSSYYWYEQAEEFDGEKEYFILNLNGTFSKVDLTQEAFNESPSDYFYIQQGSTAINYDKDRDYYTRTETYDKESHWSNSIKESPENLNFWFDFLDTEGDLSQYSVPRIGPRPKAENSSDVKAIYFRETPDVIFIDPDTSDEDITAQKKLKPGYTFVKLNDSIENLFTISTQGKSAKDELDNLLYNYAYCAESVSITAIPVYYLEPNVRIFIRDDNSGINGEYIVSRINFSLAYNGTMSVTATKAVENLY
jgi:hypothetical protein